MNEPFLGSPGVENLRFAFSVRNRPSGSCRFPNWENVEFRCSHSDPNSFIRGLFADAATVLQLDQESAIEKCEIAPGLAVFIKFAWENGHLEHCSAQAVAVPNGTIGDLFSEDPPPALYYRFDFSTEERGSLFDHPFPHVHSHFDGAPRFPFLPESDLFPLFHWLEFLMLNHHYPRWLKWAKDQCENNQAAGLRTANRSSSDLFDEFHDVEKWEGIDIAERRAFVRAAKQTLKNATYSVAKGFPKIPNDCLALNYWSP